MKKAIVLLFLIGIVISQLFNKTLAQPVGRDHFGKYGRKSADYVVGKCRFRIANVLGGHFYVPNHNDPLSQQGIYDFPDTGPKAPEVLQSFGLFCESASEDDVGAMLGAKQIDGRWLRYSPALYSPQLTPFENGAHPQTVSLKGKNWTGVALTIDDTTGDEEKRNRIFNFCLIHKGQALCGSTPVVRLAHPKRNELWMMKLILQSIMFVDPLVSVSACGSVGTTPCIK